MKKTGLCKICGKRYKYPLTIEEGEARVDMCWTCELVFTMLAGMELAIIDRYGKRYENIMRAYLKDKEEKEWELLFGKMTPEELQEEMRRVGWGRLPNDPDAGVGGHRQ